MRFFVRQAVFMEPLRATNGRYTEINLGAKLHCNVFYTTYYREELKRSTDSGGGWTTSQLAPHALLGLTKDLRLQKRSFIVN